MSNFERKMQAVDALIAGATTEGERAAGVFARDRLIRAEVARQRKATRIATLFDTSASVTGGRVDVLA